MTAAAPLLVASGPAERAKARTDLLRLFEAHGVALTKNGTGWKGLCPFHEDRSPSLSVTPEKGLWHCFGCGKGGSAIDLVMMKEGLPLERAIARLLEGGGEGSARPAAVPSTAALRDADLLERAAAHYASSLEKALKARSYLASRGLLDPEIVTRFRIGYGDGTIKAAIPSDEGMAAGILNERGVDFFYRTITFPLLDDEGRVASFYARHTQMTRHLYMRGPHRGLVNGAALRGARSIVLAESVIDALSAVRLGVLETIPLYGVNGLTEDHKAAIERAGVLEVTLLLDNDEAGERAHGPLTDALRPLGVSVFRARLPDGVKDLNEFLVKGRDPDELRALLAARVPLHIATPKMSSTKDVAATPPAPTAPPDDLPTAPPVRAKLLIPPVPADAPEDPLPSSAPAAAPSDAPAPTADEKDSPLEKAKLAGLITYKDGAAIFEMDSLRYEVKGIRLRGDETTMRLVVLVSSEAGSFRDRPDLYLHRSRRALAEEAGERLGLEPALVLAHLQRITDAIEEIRERELARLERGGEEERPPLSDEERAEAMTLLLSRDILGDAARDLDRLGYVGESENKRLAYLVATSRKTERPLSCIVRSSSGAGKSRLIDMVAELMPDEDVRLYSRITPQSLYYMGKDELAQKLLVIDERVGGEDADYSIRSLQTRRKLTLAAPIKDPSSGKIRTMTFEVNGPVALMESTTAPSVNAENANRCFELFLDESEAQTRRVHEAQRRAYGTGAWASDAERERIIRRHRNAQRLLRPLRVAIPFADAIRFPASWIRTRRDHERFLALVAMRAFLCQHQRAIARDEAGFERVEATLEDYAEAYSLSRAALAATLQDLSKPAQDLLGEVRALVARWALAAKVPPGELTFTRREVREALRWPDHKLRDGLKELVDLEELSLVSGRNGVALVYRLAPPRPSVGEVIEGLSRPEEIAAALRPG